MPSERVPGFHERRDDIAAWELATGTLACPGCDAPVLPRAGGMSPADRLSCGYCGQLGAVRDFLSLGRAAGNPLMLELRSADLKPNDLDDAFKTVSLYEALRSIAEPGYWPNSPSSRCSERR